MHTKNFGLDDDLINAAKSVLEADVPSEIQAGIRLGRAADLHAQLTKAGYQKNGKQKQEHNMPLSRNQTLYVHPKLGHEAVLTTPKHGMPHVDHSEGGNKKFMTGGELKQHLKVVHSHNVKEEFVAARTIVTEGHATVNRPRNRISSTRKIQKERPLNTGGEVKRHHELAKKHHDISGNYHRSMTQLTHPTLRAVAIASRDHHMAIADAHAKYADELAESEWEVMRFKSFITKAKRVSAHELARRKANAEYQKAEDRKAAAREKTEPQTYHYGNAVVRKNVKESISEETTAEKMARLKAAREGRDGTPVERIEATAKAKAALAQAKNDRRHKAIDKFMDYFNSLGTDSQSRSKTFVDRHIDPKTAGKKGVDQFGKMVKGMKGGIHEGFGKADTKHPLHPFLTKHGFAVTGGMDGVYSASKKVKPEQLHSEIEKHGFKEVRHYRSGTGSMPRHVQYTKEHGMGSESHVQLHHRKEDGGDGTHVKYVSLRHTKSYD